MLQKIRNKKAARKAHGILHRKHTAIREICPIPIALHIRDSTLHLLQCPSNLPPWAEKITSAMPPFHPPAAHGFFGGCTHRHRASILSSWLSLSLNLLLFIPYPNGKVKCFRKKDSILLFFVEYRHLFLFIYSQKNCIIIVYSAQKSCSLQGLYEYPHKINSVLDKYFCDTTLFL